MRAEIALARGDGEAALRAAFLGVRGTRSIPANRARFRLLRARALRLLGRPRSALRDAREARAGFEQAEDVGSAAAATAIAALCLRDEGRDGPERERLRDLAGPAHDAEAAAVAAIEASDPAAGRRRAAEARRLARHRRDRRAVEAILESGPR
jgi:hypothetical protein